MVSKSEKLLNRFEYLDALRGISAISVVILHLSTMQLQNVFFLNGYLAVDFFFILSGFVLAHAYVKPLNSGMSFLLFSLKRIIRLYPLSIAGTLFGISVLVAKLIVFPEKVGSGSEIATSAVLNLFLIPNLSSGAAFHNETFPVNGPLWSLSLELAINLIWASVLIRISFIYSIALMLASMPIILYGYFHYGAINLGFDADTFGYGIARVTFGFLAGVLIYPFRARFRLGCSKPWTSFAISCFALLFAFNVSGLFVNAIFTFILFPLIVLFMSNAVVPGRGLGILIRAGEISYPLYVLHFPVLLVASAVHQLFPSINVSLIALVALAVSIFLSWAMLHIYDKPMRRLLSRAVHRGTLPVTIPTRS